MKRHWRYLVARWGAYPVVWCLAGEGTMPYYLSIAKERDAAEHAPGGIAARLMDWLLRVELRRIRAGRSLPFGGSCLCVAVKA